MYIAQMGNCLTLPGSQINVTMKREVNALPIETAFKLPSPLPSWPQGGGFASGIMDLGGLEVCQLSSFNKVWMAREGGPDNLGATFFEPSNMPPGFSMLGCYGQPNNKQLFGWVLIGKDKSNDSLKAPIDYVLVWSSESLKIKQDGIAYFWLPTPPDNYKSVGLVITTSPDKPPLEKIHCVRSDLTDQCQTDMLIWGSGAFNIYGLTPTNRGVEGMGVNVGTFVAQNNNTNISLACLKNISTSIYWSMPNVAQIEAIFEAYSPYIYFHPDEEFLPASTEWYFTNGALLYKRGEESYPQPIQLTGANLPQGGSDDGAYWLDLPVDKNAREQLKKGDMTNCKVYLHVKPMFGATYTDIAVWIFYPFNGPARAKIKFINIPLGKIGEHIGDWEHITLRVSNLTGELWRVYLSQHSKGSWIDASDLEFQTGNKAVTYASLHGHAMYSKPGLVLQGNNGIGIRNDTAKSKFVLDTGEHFSIAATEYIKNGGVIEPPWLNYLRHWGPKIEYDTSVEIKKIERLLPGVLKSAFRKAMQGLPSEVLGEEGPTGPKVKNNWTGDES